MRKLLLSTLALGFMSTVALAEPVSLTTAQMYQVTAAGDKYYGGDKYYKDGKYYKPFKKHGKDGKVVQVAVAVAVAKSTFGDATAIASATNIND